MKETINKLFETIYQSSKKTLKKLNEGCYKAVSEGCYGDDEEEWGCFPSIWKNYINRETSKKETKKILEGIYGEDFDELNWKNPQKELEEFYASF